MKIMLLLAFQIFGCRFPNSSFYVCVSGGGGGGQGVVCLFSDLYLTKSLLCKEVCDKICH